VPATARHYAVATCSNAAVRRLWPCRALATTDRDAHPFVRLVYLVAIEAAELLFFANTESGKSGKGQQLIDNPRASLCFFWRELQEQVTLEGDVVRQIRWNFGQLLA
jgi:pyridoxine/pyridoxamine 5'-phosphate oxidase